MYSARDYAPVNQGQLKLMATAAFDELTANLPGGVGDMTGPDGTGFKLTTLINSWSKLQPDGTRVPVPGKNTADFAAVNLGQLKNVALLFYDRLIEAGYTNQYPWAGSPGDPMDYAMVNIGQMKYLFRFDVAYDSDKNGLPDWWEIKYFGKIGQDPQAKSPAGDGYTLLQEYKMGRNPLHGTQAQKSGRPTAVPCRSQSAIDSLHARPGGWQNWPH